MATTHRYSTTAKPDRLAAPRREAIAKIKAQAKRDATQAVGWLRRELEAYDSPEAGSAEKADRSGNLHDSFFIDGNEADVDCAPVGCGLVVFYDCDEIDGYDLATLSPLATQVAYGGHLSVSVSGITDELHELLARLQRVVAQSLMEED